MGGGWPPRQGGRILELRPARAPAGVHARNGSRLTSVMTLRMLLHPPLLLLGLVCTAASAAAAPPAAGFSWDTLPVHWFSSKATSQLSTAEATHIASRHSLAIISGQSHAYWAPPAETGAEAKMVEAGRLLKTASATLGRPPIAVLAYFNSVLDWTAYDYHSWLAADPSRFLCDKHGAPVYGRHDGLNHTLHIPDLSQPAVAERWLEHVVNTSRTLDGVFVDQAKWCAPFVCGKRNGTYLPGKRDAWAQAHWAMLLKLRVLLADKIVVINNQNITDFPAGFDHEYEHFGEPFRPVSPGLNARSAALQLRSLQADAACGRLATVHIEDLKNFATLLPLFLLGAGSNAYFAAPFEHGPAGTPGDRMWILPAWDGWRPEYSRALGAPLGAANVDAAGIATRRFASGTHVLLNLTAIGSGTVPSGCVWWSDGNLTGDPSTCGIPDQGAL